ncbi:hypothetical protein CWS72_09035 [Telmatospirillum siberiense]|uniref:Uncharacterized protein n=1 Tax=Telmatospirillum siberiense TaxID=382514 RepID=A0A2N3PX77_9PROT|nr:hypothetical protein CWS72_09035 [Telmatospirillum siberiense]
MTINNAEIVEMLGGGRDLVRLASSVQKIVADLDMPRTDVPAQHPRGMKGCIPFPPPNPTIRRSVRSTARILLVQADPGPKAGRFIRGHILSSQ